MAKVKGAFVADADESLMAAIVKLNVSLKGPFSVTNWIDGVELNHFLL